MCVRSQFPFVIQLAQYLESAADESNSRSLGQKGAGEQPSGNYLSAEHQVVLLVLSQPLGWQTAHGTRVWDRCT